MSGQDNFSLLEKKVKKAVALIGSLQDENQRLRDGGNGESFDPGSSKKVPVLEARVKTLEEENAELHKKKKIISEKVETMLKKYDILKL